MLKLHWFLLLLTITSGGLQAKPLQLAEQYEVFDGKTIDLRQVVGHQPVYIKFWATWCLECRKELPSLQNAFEKYRDKISMYAVNLNINETDEYIRRLKTKNNLTIPIVMDDNGSIASNFQFVGTPFHVLINAKGDVVYTTYKDDEALQQQLQLLAASSQSTISSQPEAPTKNTIPTLPNGFSLVYFSATWCDWYMKDIHPEMTSNCLSATKLVNDLHQQTKIPLFAYVTHLWTEQKDVDEYVKKFSIGYPVNIDADNQLAQHYRTTDYPSLLLFKDGKEVKRFTEFDDTTEMSKTISKLAAEK
ncbi:MAG TPA: redoxin domain-containing protein [Cellvibrio sp.]|nr:redoxin domain-containing protein [Cellvibrio sp.]